jgi:hypothetical protein
VERKGDTRRQHYVPQLILRNFSTNGATTSLVVLSSGKRVVETAINRQCYRPYFYGEDQVMERSFAREETKIATILGDLSRARLEALTDDDIEALKFFVHYQHARTLGAAESLSNFAAAFARHTLEETARLNNDDELRESLDHVKIRMNEAQHERLWHAGKSTPLMYDLAVRFVMTSRPQGFVIGDHPVVAYNQFAEHHPILSRYPTSTGLALKGLQLFMPLSPSVTLACFDPSTYEYDGKLVTGAGPRDVRFLNEVQAVNALECVYFQADRTEDAALEGLLAKRRDHPSPYEKTIATTDIEVRADGTMRQLVIVTHPDIKVGAHLSFVRVTDKRSYEYYEGPTIPVRSPALVEFTERYGKFLEDEVERGRAAKGISSESVQPPPSER